MLRNVTDLGPVTHNETRWTSKFSMIKRINQIRDEIIQVSQEENANIRVNTSEVFKEQAERYEAMLKYFNIATTELQKNSRSSTTVAALFKHSRK